MGKITNPRKSNPRVYDYEMKEIHSWFHVSFFIIEKPNPYHHIEHVS